MQKFSMLFLQRRTDYCNLGPYVSLTAHLLQCHECIEAKCLRTWINVAHWLKNVIQVDEFLSGMPIAQ